MNFCKFPDIFRTFKNPTKTGQFPDRFLTNSCCPEYCKIPDNPFFVRKNFSQKPDVFFIGSPNLGQWYDLVYNIGYHIRRHHKYQ